MDSILYPIIPVALTGVSQIKEIWVLDTEDALRFLGTDGTCSMADADNIPPCVTRALKRRSQTRDIPNVFTV